MIINYQLGLSNWELVDAVRTHGLATGGDAYLISISDEERPSQHGLLGIENGETYKIVTVCFDHEGNELAPVGVAPVFGTGCAFPTFGIVKPAVAIHAWEYRQKWCGEEEKTAKARARGLVKGKATKGGTPSVRSRGGSRPSSRV